jgi:hypothetical protein
MEGNTITENHSGIKVYDDPEIGIHQNCIAGNSDYGLFAHWDHTVVDASENWWGHPTGPLAEENPSGFGDIVSGKYVTVTNWLTETNCATDMVSKIITPAGGTIQSSDGKVSLEVPPDGVHDPTLLGMVLLLAQVSEEQLMLFLIHAVPEGAEFNNKPRLIAKYSEEQVSKVDESSLAFYTRQESADSTKSATPAGFEDEWIRLPTSQVDLENNLVTATIDELGTFALIGDLAERKIYLPFVFNP